MELFTLENLFTLGMLTLLQAVLGFDNLLYISLESKRAPVEAQARVRKLGIAIAMILRIVLLFVLISMFDYFQEPWFALNTEVLKFEMNLRTVIVLLGGVFIIYTAMKEIWHMVSMDDLSHDDRKPQSVAVTISLIVAMNVVFSFDSILSAIALTDVFIVMAIAIIIGGVLMIWLAEKVVTFLERNRMYEVLGLFILFVVGIMLLSEGGHLAQLEIFGGHITPMSKATFYFVIAVLVLTDIVQSRYQKRLTREREIALERARAAAPVA